MTLTVHVLGHEVATLEAIGDFRSSMTYHEGVAPEDFVSLTMRVRRESYQWDDVLPPVFQMNLPEGYLLQVLQEQFGPHVGASPLALLSVIGRNMIGRLQVAPPGAILDQPPKPVDVAGLLQGDNSEEAFAELVRQHATSGVSGVVPKFLDGDAEKLNAWAAQEGHAVHPSPHHQGFIEAFAVRILERAPVHAGRQPRDAGGHNRISRDGQALIVDRFDVDGNGVRLWGMEDFCALLGLRPAAKYETTWERIAKAVRDHVPAGNRLDVFRQMTTLLLLTYALRNADCHAKNVALRYTSREDVHLAPAYDMITTAAYPDYQNNPPGISFMGKKSWDPGKSLQTFITATFGISVREQAQILDQIATAMAEVGPMIRTSMEEHPGFREIGKRMLLAWRQGIDGLRSKRSYDLGQAALGEAYADFSGPLPIKAERKVIGRSDLLGGRR